MRLLSSALRQLFAVSLILGVSFSASAKIDSLPADLQLQETQIENAHEEGLAQFFQKLNEDCDSQDILSKAYSDVKTLPASPKLFRIESRVMASCQRQELWYCYSSFQSDGTYRYTDCETDAPSNDQ